MAFRHKHVTKCGRALFELMVITLVNQEVENSEVSGPSVQTRLHARLRFHCLCT